MLLRLLRLRASVPHHGPGVLLAAIEATTETSAVYTGIVVLRGGVGLEFDHDDYDIDQYLCVIIIMCLLGNVSVCNCIQFDANENGI